MKKPIKSYGLGGTMLPKPNFNESENEEVKVTELDNRETIYSFDTAGMLLSSSCDNGELVNFTYDGVIVTVKLSPIYL